jgi:hypothetical protein
MMCISQTAAGRIMATHLTIVYTYRFKNGVIRTFSLLLDKGTLALAPGIRGTPPLGAS